MSKVRVMNSYDYGHYECEIEVVENQTIEQAFIEAQSQVSAAINRKKETEQRERDEYYKRIEDMRAKQRELSKAASEEPQEDSEDHEDSEELCF